MKKYIIVAISLSLSVFSYAVQAADGTIKFTGEIIDQTCTIDNTQGLTVDLGKISASSLTDGTSTGIKSGSRTFTLQLTDCPDTISTAKVIFGGTPDGIRSDLLALDNEGGDAATGVAIEIADNNGTPIPLHTSSPSFALQPGNNALKFIASYVSTATAVTTGPANGTSEFTIDYK